MKKSLLTLPLLLIAAALSLAACGGGDSSSSGGGDDETAIEESIEAAATTADPSKCTKFQTQEFDEYESGETGKAAVKGCEKQVEEEPPAESVDVSNISVDGETATAEAALTGSPLLDGQSLEIEMAKEDGAWKINKFVKFTKYDGAQFAEGLEKEIESEGELAPSVAKCVGKGFADLSQEESETIFLERNEQPLVELLKSCE